MVRWREDADPRRRMTAAPRLFRGDAEAEPFAQGPRLHAYGNDIGRRADPGHQFRERGRALEPLFPRALAVARHRHPAFLQGAQRPDPLPARLRQKPVPDFARQTVNEFLSDHPRPHGFASNGCHYQRHIQTQFFHLASPAKQYFE